MFAHFRIELNAFRSLHYVQISTFFTSSEVSSASASSWHGRVMECSHKLAGSSGTGAVQLAELQLSRPFLQRNRVRTISIFFIFKLQQRSLQSVRVGLFIRPGLEWSDHTLYRKSRNTWRWCIFIAIQFIILGGDRASNLFHRNNKAESFLHLSEAKKVSRYRDRKATSCPPHNPDWIATVVRPSISLSDMDDLPGTCGCTAG